MKDTKPLRPLSLTETLALYTKLGYGVVFLFALVGFIVRPNSIHPLVVLCFMSVCWVCFRVVSEALQAYAILARHTPPNDKKPPTDGPNLPPPTANVT